MGPWGPVADATTFVDASASPNGDGSKETPFRSLTDALATGTDIALAAGTYVENVTLNGNVDGLRIRGRCAALVSLDGREGAETAQTLLMSGHGAVALSSLTITGGPYGGIGVISGSLNVTDAVVHENTTVGVILDNAGELSLTDSTISDTRSTADGGYGRGLVVSSHTTATVSRSTIIGNQHVGVYAKGVDAVVALDDVDVINTRAEVGDQNGYGLEVLAGASATITNTRIGVSVGAGVIADGDGTVVVINDSTVSGTMPGESNGRGVVAQGGATVSLTRSSLLENATLGATSAGTGTRLTLTDVEITGVPATPEATSGYGLEVMRGGTLSAADSSVTAAFGAGIVADGAGSTLALDGVNIIGTQTYTDGTGGLGIAVQDSAAATIRDCTIKANHSVGVFATSPGTSVELATTLISGTLGARPAGGGAPDELGRGVEVSEGAAFDSHGSTVENNRECGIVVSGEGTMATLDADEITSTSRGTVNGYAVGVIAQVGGTITANSIVTSDHAGPGLAVAEHGSFTCTACTVERNTFAGAVVDAGRLDLIGGSILDTASDVTGGGGVGVYAGPALGSVVTVDSATIARQPLASVWFGGPGTFIVQRSMLESGSGLELRPGLTAHGNAVYAGSGIRAWDGESGLLLALDTLTSGPGPVVLLDGAGIETTGNTWEGAATSIVQQACGDIPPALLADDAPAVEICPASDQLVLPMVFSIELAETEALSE